MAIGEMAPSEMPAGEEEVRVTATPAALALIAEWEVITAA